MQFKFQNLIILNFLNVECIVLRFSFVFKIASGLNVRRSLVVSVCILYKFHLHNLPQYLLPRLCFLVPELYPLSNPVFLEHCFSAALTLWHKRNFEFGCIPPRLQGFRPKYSLHVNGTILQCTIFFF